MARGTGKILPRGIEKDKMELGIHVSGVPPKPGLLSRRPDPETLLQGIDGAIKDAVTDPVQKLLTARGLADGVLYLRLHPGAEDISFTVEDGKVVATARTSSAGPGYHAMLVDFLEDIGRRTGIVWSWEGKGDREGDETGYHRHRDFDKLRGAMAEWLKDVAGHVAELDHDAGSIRLNLPAGESVTDSFAVAPMGKWPREWFADVAQGDQGKLSKAGAEFFTAWHTPDSAEYWANCGRYLMLWELDWVRPETPAERGLYEKMLGCFAKTRELDPALDLPEAELKEAWALLNGAEADAPPRPGGIGFRRGLMERPLIDPWTASIPGYFRSESRDEGEGPSVVYWFGSREVQMTAMSFDDEPDGTKAEDFIRRHAAQDNEGDIFPFDPAHPYLTGRAVAKEENKGVWTVYGMLGTGRDLCFVNLLHEDTDEGRQWAKAVLESVSCPPPPPTPTPTPENED